MSDYPTPPGVPVDYAGYNQPQAPQATSSAAVAAFVCSLVCCVPILTQLAGLILGIIGISKTSAGKARGRWMAIAAVIISPLAALAWVGIFVMVIKVTLAMMTLGMQLEPMLDGTETDLPALVSKLHESAFSKRLQVRVDEEAVLSFQRDVQGTYGVLVELLQDQQQPLSHSPESQSSVIHLDASFEKDGVRQDTTIVVTLGFEGFVPKIDNIKIGDLELAPEQ